MTANEGPWKWDGRGAPPAGLATTYFHLEQVRAAIWDLPSTVAGAYRDSTPIDPRQANAAEAIREAVRGPWVGFCCDEFQHSVAFGAFPYFYGRMPSLGQEILLMGNSPRGGGANSTWWPDRKLSDAWTCALMASDPDIFPTKPARRNEVGWTVSLTTHARVGLTLRNEAGEPVTEAMIRCHFRPSECGPTPPHPPPPTPPPSPPPPPPESDCEPVAESRWAKSCRESGHPDLEECRVWTEANSPKRTVWKLLQQVCPEEEPPPPDPPPPPPPPVETCILCSWDAGQRLFRPGAPSTGKLTIELVCVGVECPGEGP